MCLIFSGTNDNDTILLFLSLKSFCYVIKRHKHIQEQNTNLIQVACTGPILGPWCSSS